MQEPTGFSGVHTVPNILQSCGRLTPRRMAPHSQALLSAPKHSRWGKRRSASKLGELLADAQRRIGHDTEPAPLELAAQLEYFGDEVLRLEVAVARHGARELVLDLGAAFIDLATSIRIACITSSGSKPAMTTGFRYSSAKNS
jgi:hypothetical protein